MVLRVGLSDADLQHVAIATGPAPLIELSDHVRRAAAPASARGRTRQDLALLQHLYGGACCPGFLHPDVTDAHEAIEAIARTPTARVRRDLLDNVAAGYPLAPWTVDLARAGRQGLVLRHRLAGALTDLLATAVQPALDRVAPLARRRRDDLLEVRRRDGVAGMLDALGPGVRFRAPVLEVDLVSGADVDVAAGGNGLVLVPSFADAPTVGVSSTGRPTVVTFPVAASAAVGPGSPDPALRRLLGSNRATVLALVAAHPGCGTRELGRLARLSAAATSVHVRVLRENGLVETVTSPSRSRHHVTALGHRLLRSG